MAQQEHGSCPDHHFAVPGPWDALWGGVLRSSLLKATLLPSDPVLAGALTHLGRVPPGGALQMVSRCHPHPTRRAAHTGVCGKLLPL